MTLNTLKRVPGGANERALARFLYQPVNSFIGNGGSIENCWQAGSPRHNWLLFCYPMGDFSLTETSGNSFGMVQKAEGVLYKLVRELSF